MKRELYSPDEMEIFAREWVNTVKPKTTAYLVALKGDLGAGKTTFVQGVARVFKVTEHVTSPTFVIQKKYLLQGQSFERLVHIDAYRFNEPKEVDVLSLEETLADPGNIVFIEWPEKVPGLLPDQTIAFTWLSDTVRAVEIEKVESTHALVFGTH